MYKQPFIESLRFFNFADFSPNSTTFQPAINPCQHVSDLSNRLHIGAIECVGKDVGDNRFIWVGVGVDV